MDLLCPRPQSPITTDHHPFDAVDAPRRSEQLQRPLRLAGPQRWERSSITQQVRTSDPIRSGGLIGPSQRQLRFAEADDP